MQSDLSPSLKCCVNLAKESGSSSWLTVTPILEHGFHLQKGDFWDALSLRYGITPSNTSSTCQCGTSFSVDHAMVCPFGGFPMIIHNEVQDLTASLLTEVCHNVATEPSLQPITSDFFLASANTTNDARLNVKARGFWSRGWDAYFDVGYFTPMLPATVPLALLLFINAMKIQKSENMAICKLGTLSIESSLHWSLLLMVAWDVRPLYFTGV